MARIYFINFSYLFCLIVRGHGDLLVSVLDSGASGPGESKALAGDIVLCSWVRHYSHSASLHGGCLMLLKLGEALAL